MAGFIEKFLDMVKLSETHMIYYRDYMEGKECRLLRGNA